MKEIVKKERVWAKVNKHGEIIGDGITPIEFELEYNEDNLSPMCKDLLKVIKDEWVFSIWIVSIDNRKMFPDFHRFYWDFENVTKIVFGDYYLTIDGLMLFYNAIFDFSKARTLKKTS